MEMCSWVGKIKKLHFYQYISQPSYAKDVLKDMNDLLFTDNATKSPKRGTFQQLTWTTGNHYLNCTCCAKATGEFQHAWDSGAHKSRHRASQSVLFCLFYLLRAALVMFLFTMLHRVRVGRQGQRTYELILWKDGATYGAHHVIWVIRLIANAFWMHPDVWLQLWKPSNNENVQTHIEEFQSGIFDMITTKHMLFFEVVGVTNMLQMILEFLKHHMSLWSSNVSCWLKGRYFKQLWGSTMKITQKVGSFQNVTLTYTSY